MKRLTFFASFIMLCLFASGQTKQDVMVIEKKDGTSLRLNVDDIQRAVFETAFVNPAGTVATAVDLGLPSGVKWASWNLGATKSEEYGGYYGWGDVTGQKTSTDVDDYPSSTPPAEISGTQYDIAKALWGSEWRMPTYDDIQELYENCQFYKSDNNIEIVGPNKNSIILPLAGSREESEIYDTVNYGYYWSGTRHKDDAKCAWLLNFDMVNNKYGLAGGSRHFGLTVRPVFGKPIVVSVSTGSATGITESGATISGTISGVSSSVTVGIIYGTSSTLSSTSGTKKSTTSKDNYSVTLSGLSANTTYYYRAYALINDKYYYGDTKSFTTKEKATTGTLNGHEWVDLGLPSGTKWATCNVGASSPEDYGDYYAWGECYTKAGEYGTDNYTYCTASSTSTRFSYLGYDISGTTKDVARVKWGIGWKMPTNAQKKELLNHCSKSWTSQNGVSGFLFTSQNGNTLFLPAAGRKARSLLQNGSYGYYWTANSKDGYAGDVYYIMFNGDNMSNIYADWSDWGHLGCSVRPVTE